MNISFLQRLKNRKIIRSDQHELLLPTTCNTVDSEEFDITLLMTLLTNLCGFTYPGANFNPGPTDTSVFADLFRIKQNRDKVKHRPSLSVSDHDFNHLFTMLTKPMLALGLPQVEIDQIKTMAIRDKDTKAQIDTLNKMENSLKSFNFNNMPPVDNFFSREDVVDEVHNKLMASFQKKLGVVIYGYPGLGKSESARRYWEKFGKSNYDDIVIWINAETAATMEDQFRQIAIRCGLKDKITNPDGTYMTTNEIVDAVYLFFSSTNTATTPHLPNKRVLFVFDGANNQTLLYNFLPQSINDAPYILITSQCTAWDKRFDAMELDVFSEDEAFQFFTLNIVGSHQLGDDATTKKLLHRLSYHPLALQQAVSYINKNGLAVHDFIKLFDQNKKAIHSEKLDQIQRMSVYNTLSLSIGNLKGIDGDAYDLLTLMTHLDSKEMKKGLFLHVFGRNLLELTKSLSLLRKYSLISYAIDNTTSPFDEQIVIIHSLTQDYLEIICQDANLDVPSLTENAKFFFRDLDNCKKNFELMSAKYWINHFHNIYENQKKSFWFLKEFSNEKGLGYLYDMFQANGINRKAIEVFKYMVEQFEGQPDGIHLMRAPSYFLDRCFRIEGECDDKKIYYLGLENKLRDRLTQDWQVYTKHQLAHCLLTQKKFVEATTLFEEIVAYQLKEIGSQHENYLVAKFFLGRCFEFQGNFNDAIKSFSEIISVNHDVYDQNHEYVLGIKRHIASCYQSQRKFDDAIPLYHEVIQAKYDTIGPKHHSYLETKYFLGRCLQEQGNFDEAIKIYEDVIVIEHDTIGPRHESYLMKRFQLALCFQSQEKFDEASQIFEEILKVQESTIGPRHQQYLKTQLHLDQCYDEINKTSNPFTALVGWFWRK